MQNTDHTFKVLLIGDSSVGKSSLLLQFVEEGEAFDQNQTPTIGVDFKSKTINTQNKSILLNVWDTAGQEKFRSLTASYYKGTQGIVLCFDLCSQRSFQDLDSWIHEIELYANHKNVALVLAGNKIDRAQEREVSRSEAESWAKAHDMPYFEVSAKTKKGIDETFQALTTIILSRESLYKNVQTKKMPVAPEQPPQNGLCSC